MSVTVIVGAQWGDEGKGRIVDYLAQRADVVIRYQGGDNAGHTVINDHGTFFLHIIPSGIFNPKTKCIVGTGTVVNPQGLLEELDTLSEAGICLDNLWLSDRAHVVMPYHRLLDELEETSASGRKLGTTKRGIGPAYADKASRHGIQLGDLLRPDQLRTRLWSALDRVDRQLAYFDHPPTDREAILSEALKRGQELSGRIIDTLPMIQSAVEAGEDVLLEGQLGVMRDLDWGIYPYVTSSNPTAGAGCAGAGIPPREIHDVVGVVKAYSTAVGDGPFPVELHDDIGTRLRSVGKEYGATTGRPRRCGWFDGVAIKYASWLNGFTSLAVTKLDVLDDFDELKICVGYRLDGEVIDRVVSACDLDRVEPLYESWPGWNQPTGHSRAWDDLPEAARAYLTRLSGLASAPIKYVSVGPEREKLIVMRAGTEVAAT